MGEGLFQPMHLLIIFVIALLVFGPKNLPGLGKGLGEAIRGFKDALKGGGSVAPTSHPDAKALPDAKNSEASSEEPKP